MKFKRITAVIVTLILCFNLSSCKKADNSSVSAPENTADSADSKSSLTLLYSAADTFNPYTVKTNINRQLCQLLYDPLITLDSEYNPVYKIADSVTVLGKQCTVTVRDTVFSDGSTVSADDVVYSYNLAKKSSGIYSAALYEALSATAKDKHTVIFSLAKADPYFENTLTFPIIKSGSEKMTDSDSVLRPPIGCGRYKVSEDGVSLTANEKYYGKTGSITEIKLINAPDTESVAHYVEIGAADMYYSSIQKGSILRMSGKKLDINLNSIVYIGVNRNYGALADVILRQALSSGIDRQKICRNAYYNNALPATGFFNPVWKETKSVQNLQIDANEQITVENLEKIGYNRFDKKGNRINSSGAKLSFSLLVNSENRIKASAARLIATQLKAYGINITVVEKSYSDYSDCLKKGEFQLFLGEVKLTDNMDISCMINEGGSAAYGLVKKSDKDNASSDKESGEKGGKDTASDDGADENKEPENTADRSNEVLTGFYEGKNTIADTASVLQTEMPFIPVCYRTGALFFNDNIENVNNSSESDIYFSIDSYIYN